MTSKERVYRAIEFRDPDRIPRGFGLSPSEPNAKYYAEKYGNDIVTTAFTQKNRPVELSEADSDTSNLKRRAWYDEWGVLWQSISTDLGEVKRSAIANWDELSDLQIPDYGSDWRYDSVRETVKNYPDKFVLGSLGLFVFETMHSIRDFTELLMDFYIEEEKVAEFADMLADTFIQVIRAYARAGVDGVIAYEDWGLQDRLIISPEKWREIMKPVYKRITDVCSQENLKFFFHSCGYISDILEDLQEIGVDVLQLDQQNNIGIQVLSEKAAGKICFFCPLDIQMTPWAADPAALENGIVDLVTALERNGGFIAKLYSQPSDIGITHEMLETICETFVRF